ncbi:ribonuclease III [Spirochaetia bacterium 38H-sp]|uniref:Ribonuclease 3 n=1 Tax=Rarispira pelagica TaxID=3141764 RepID=A0ABU9UB79_9SPIR
MWLLKGLFDSSAPSKISEDRRKELLLFEKQNGIRFRSLELLNLAFSHRSYAHEQVGVGDNERLEFLGDSVLGLAVADYLYNTFPDKAEGELARIKSFVVSEDTLYDVALKIKVDNFILISKGEEFSGGRSKKALLADATEAIIGAYYLDAGFEAAKDFVLRLIVPEIDKVVENRHKKDYKTLLQEYVQKNFKTYPKYRLVQKKGPDHNRTFVIEVMILDKSYGPGKGKNKKEAEQDAAAIAYKALAGSNTN